VAKKGGFTKMMATASTTYGDQSSYTAYALVLRRAAWTRIPFSCEIADILDREGIFSENDRKRAAGYKSFTPFLEARYLMTQRQLDERGLHQVVELAAGFSPRGIAMASANPEINYIEVDYTRVIELKRMIVERLISSGAIGTLPNLHFIEGDATQTETLRHIEALLRNEPVDFTFEGFLRYVSFGQKQTFLTTICEVVETYGGGITTPDVEFSENELASLEQQQRYAAQALTGMDVRPNLFKDKAHMDTFVRRCGLDIEYFPLTDIADQLVSPARLMLGTAEVVAALRHRAVAVLTPLM
jgi:O-methyltransferase involved in polyketide biosynthesis